MGGQAEGGRASDLPEAADKGLLPVDLRLLQLVPRVPETLRDERTALPLELPETELLNPCDKGTPLQI